jgi:hypothetical protein
VCYRERADRALGCRRVAGEVNAEEHQQAAHLNPKP